MNVGEIIKGLERASEAWRETMWPMVFETIDEWDEIRRAIKDRPGFDESLSLAENVRRMLAESLAVKLPEPTQDGLRYTWGDGSYVELLPDSSAWRAWLPSNSVVTHRWPTPEQAAAVLRIAGYARDAKGGA